MSKILEQIAKARAGGHSDQEIWQHIQKMPKHAMSIEKARVDGHSQQSIAQGLGLNITVKPVYVATKKQEVEKPSFLVDVGSGMDKVFSGVAQGAEYTADGIRGGLNKLLGTNLETDRYEKYTASKADQRDTYNKAREASGAGLNVGEFVGEMIASAPGAMYAKGYQGARVLSSAKGWATTGHNALVGAGIGGASFAKNSEERTKNTAVGAVGGGLGAIVGEKAGRAVIKAVNATKGKMDDAVKGVDDLAKKHGVRTTAGDLGRNPLVQKTEVAMENVPIVGTSNVRKQQHDQAKKAAEKVTDNLKEKMTTVEYKGIKEIEKAASSGDRNAMRISQVIKDAGDDASKIIQAGAEVRAWREGKIAKQMYDEVQGLAKNQGGTVAPTNTLKSLDDRINQELSSLAPDEQLLRDIQRIKGHIDDATKPKTFENMRLLRSQLGDLAEKYMKGADPNKSASKYFGDLRANVESDISDFVAKSGNSTLKDAYKRADGFYKTIMNNRDSSIAKAMKNNKPDEIFDQFIKTGKADRASNFYRNLDPKAQSALRYQLAENAMNKAVNPSTQAFSPAKFALEFERMRAPYESIFKGSDKAEMDGFVKLMRHVERAGQYMENPPTGNRWAAGLAAGGTAALNTPLVLKAAGASALAKVLFTTEMGKRILFASRDLPPNSPKMENLYKMAQQLAVATGANMGID